MEDLLGHPPTPRHRHTQVSQGENNPPEPSQVPKQGGSTGKATALAQCGRERGRRPPRPHVLRADPEPPHEHSTVRRPQPPAPREGESPGPGTPRRTTPGSAGWQVRAGVVTALSAPCAVSGTGPQSKVQKTPWSEPKDNRCRGSDGGGGEDGGQGSGNSTGVSGERRGAQKRSSNTVKTTEEPKLAEPLGKGGG